MKGHVQPVTDGVWRIYIENGRDPLTGRRRRITTTFHGTRPEAEEAATRLVISVRDGKHKTAVATFGALLDAWLQNSEDTLSPLTMRGYRTNIEVHIRPALGELKLTAVTTARLDEFYRALRARGAQRPKKGGPLSAQSVKHCHSIIHRACEQGRRWGWLTVNPAELAQPPTIEPRPHHLPDVAAILTILAELIPDMRELAWVAIVSGARRGELCGLRWSDVDLAAGTDDQGRAVGELRIVRSVAKLTGRAPIVKGTKTGRERKLALDAATVALLAGRHARQAATALACGQPLEQTAYVFSEVAGATDPLLPQTISTRWGRGAKAAGVGCRFHDLRHLSVSELLEAGFEVGGVSQRAGHSRTSITQDIYQHTRRSKDLASSEYLAGLLNVSTT